MKGKPHATRAAPPKKISRGAGRPAAPDRELKGVWLQMPEPLRDRLHARAKTISENDPLGLITPARALALRYISEGLERDEAADRRVAQENARHASPPVTV